MNPFIESSDKHSRPDPFHTDPYRTGQGFVAVVLAAGQGTRLFHGTPKPLVPVAGRPMVDYVVDAVCGCASRPYGSVSDSDPYGPERCIFVVGYQAERVRAHLEYASMRVNGYTHTRTLAHPLTFEYVLQPNPLGTGDALKRAACLLKDYHGDVLVLNADKPLFTTASLSQLLSGHRDAAAGPAAKVFATLMTGVLENPHGYGRILKDEGRRQKDEGGGLFHPSSFTLHPFEVERIVEQKEATPEEQEIREVNGGAYCFRAPEVFELLNLLEPRGKNGEYYLTDVIGLARGRGWQVCGIEAPCPDIIRGINTPEELAEVERILEARRANSQQLFELQSSRPA